jgi:hypothetical protein
MDQSTDWDAELMKLATISEVPVFIWQFRENDNREIDFILGQRDHVRSLPCARQGTRHLSPCLLLDAVPGQRVLSLRTAGMPSRVPHS